MATKITTDKIGKDGGKELTLPSSSQTLPAEGELSNLQVNSAGEIQIGSAEGGTSTAKKPVKYYMDKDGKFYTEGKKFDCEEFVLTKDNYTASTQYNWTYVRFGHAGNNSSSGDSIVINGVTYTTRTTLGGGDVNGTNEILHIGFEVDNYGVIEEHSMAYHPISGCTKSSIENVKSQTQHSEPTDAMDANEFSVVTTPSNYWSDNSQNQGQYKGATGHYRTVTQDSTYSAQGSSYSQDYVELPVSNTADYNGFPTRDNAYSLGLHCQVKFALYCKESSTTYTSPQGTATTKGAKNAHFGGHTYEITGHMGSRNNSRNMGIGGESLGSSTSYGVPIWINSFNGFCFKPKSITHNGTKEVLFAFRPYVVVNQN